MAYLKLLKLTFASLSLGAIFHAELLASPNVKINDTHTARPKADLSKNAAIRKEQERMNSCKLMDPAQLNAPRITITKVKQSSALRGGKYRVEGVIDGVCIKEAALYENSKRVFKFPLETTPFYKRYDFEIEVIADTLPEIRAFDINWQRSSKMLLKDIK